MTNVEKRIAIIKDVLKRLPSRKVAQNFYIRDIKVRDLKPEDLKKEAQDEIGRIEKCRACALGNMLMSHIRVFDKITLEDIGIVQKREYNYSELNGIKYLPTGELRCSVGRDETTKPLSKYFTDRQLDMIETAFEMRSSGDLDTCNPQMRNIVEKCVSFGKQHKSAKERLRAIMKNMLKNNGTFIP